MAKTKKLLSVFLALLMLLTVFPLSIIANAVNAAAVTVESVNAVPGSNVEVNINVRNNPGIMAANFTVTYDDGLTLVDSKSGDAFSALSMTKPESYKSPCKFAWDALELADGDIKDGTILTLVFSIDKSVKANSKLNVKLSYQNGNIIDSDLNDIPVTINNGNITIIDYIPGDINGDGTVDLKDVTLVRRLVTGYNVTANKLAADVNGDGEVTMKDVVLIRRYVVDAEGYGVVLVPGGSNVHTHTMTATAAKNATCTEDGNIAYWYCSSCETYFSDKEGKNAVSKSDTVIKAAGHTIVTDPAVNPTYDSTGLTEGSHCSTCGTVLMKQEVIPKLQKTEYAITYRIAINDNYLQSLNIDNPNPSIYTSQDGLELQDLIVDGYEFKGWYTAQTGGTRVTEIQKGSTGNKTLYAQWNKVEYVIDFDSPDAPVSSITYTVDRGTTLTNPSWFGYTFVGWSKDGNIVSSVKPGTTGNIVLHANWTSNRNKARAVDKLENPNIIEDVDNGRYMFVYEIGTIENVPLSEDGGEQINSEGITITKELSMSKSVQEGTADKIAKTVAKATTETSAWTLSENWNKSTSATNEHDEQIGKTQQRTDSEGNVVSGKYYVSNSKGGSTSVSSSVGGSSSNSSKVTAGASIGINGEYSHKENDGTSVTATTSKTKEKEFNWNLGGSYGQNSSAKLGFDLGEGISAGVQKGSNWSINGGIGGSSKSSVTDTISASASHDEENAYKISNSRNFNVGTENSSTSEGHWDTSSSSSSTWNSTNGYESSEQASKNTTVSNAISEVINDRYSYTSTDSRGGNNSSTRSTADTSSLSDEYASTVEYSTENTESEKKTLQFKSSATGYYRVITAGTVHVFGVVGYDIATNSYFTYTYNVLDSERHAYLDYSKDNSRFTDCENGVIPFEIPYEVNDYISVKIGRSEGLVINEQTGVVKGYNGNAGYVVIPEYISASDGLNKAKAVKVTGISENAFKGNTNIKGVLLPKHIREIPANAFEGCTSLQTLIAMGINNIGDETFKNCTSLKTFIVDEFVTSLGKNAFVNVPEVYFNAANESVAKTAFGSGADKILVYLSNMTGSLDNYKISIPSSTEFFALMSDGREYKNLSVDSSADETFLSNFKLTENSDTPLKINSDTITLSRVTVEQSPSFSLISIKDNVSLKLYGNTKLSSKGENAVLTKNINLSLVNNNIDGLVDVVGNWLINGDITNSQNLSVNYTNGKLIHITDTEFNNYLTSSKLTFDSNGGNAVSEVKTIYYGQKYGELPTPIRDNYTFKGWFTEKENGNRITADTVVNALVNQTLYAHWTPNQYSVSFDVNGDKASVNVNKKTLTFGDALGSLPTPTRDYYNFEGWYTAKDGGTKVTETTTFKSAADVTVYAHWKLKAVSGWVVASSMPANAQVINTKWTYTLREYSESSSSSKSGWTKYDTKRTSWGAEQGPVYSNPDNGSRSVRSESYVVSSNYKTVYKYYRYAVNRTGGYGSYAQSSSYPTYYEYTFDSPLAADGTSGGHSKYRYWYSSSNYISVYDQWTAQEWVSDNYGTRWYYKEPIYTYYYYKDVAKETTSGDPTGNTNVSNVVKYVQYRKK